MAKCGYRDEHDLAMDQTVEENMGHGTPQAWHEAQSAKRGHAQRKRAAQLREHIEARVDQIEHFAQDVVDEMGRDGMEYTHDGFEQLDAHLCQQSEDRAELAALKKELGDDPPK